MSALDPGSLAGQRKHFVLREEAIAGMNCACARRFDGFEDRVDMQVTLASGRSADVDGFIRKANMQAVRIGI